jgi:hypothetical protein
VSAPDQDFMARQGDVLVRAIASIPAGVTPIPRDGGRIVLAYGEATGHSHAIAAPEPEAQLLTDEERRRFLRLVADVDLVHEEHATVRLPAGLYEVVQQRVYVEPTPQDDLDWRYAGD